MLQEEIQRELRSKISVLVKKIEGLLHAVDHDTDQPEEKKDAVLQILKDVLDAHAKQLELLTHRSAYEHQTTP